MFIYGKNPVKELLSDPGSRIDEILIARDVKGDKGFDVYALAKSRGIKISSLPRDAITRIAGTPSHQGVVARVPEYEYVHVDLILDEARKKGEKLLLVILDHIEDPQNLGAIIRTVDVLGGHGVVIPKDRAASVTPAVVKASAGAVNHVLISRVVNLVSVIESLKGKGVWVVGADASSRTPLYGEEFSNLDLAVVIGSEGKGLGKAVRDKCDFLVSIPQTGKVSSLNASVAAGIMIYEIVRQRASKVPA